MVASLPTRIYDDLYQFLVPGFVAATVTLGGRQYGLRSLSPGDFQTIAGLAKENHPEWKLRVAAASLYHVDGHYLLESSSSAAAMGYRALQRCTHAAVRALFATQLGFYQRYRRASGVLEPYLYSDENRRLWHSTHNGTHPLWTRASVPGLERLGYNPLQAQWTAWNRLEDVREEQEYAWSITKVLVGLQSSKAARQLDARDTARHEAEKARKERSIRRAVRLYLGMDPGVEDLVERGGLKVHQPNSPEELADEYRRWCAGELDDHDRVVTGYKERLRLQVQEREAERARAQAVAAARRTRDSDEPARATLVGMTAEQVDRLVGTGPRIRRVAEAERQSRTYNRYLREEPGPPEGVTVEPGGLRIEPPLVDPPPTLQEQVDARRPRHG